MILRVIFAGTRNEVGRIESLRLISPLSSGLEMDDSELKTEEKFSRRF
jgi:hypothetical protein